MRKRKQNKRQMNHRQLYEQFIVDFDVAISELLADETLDEEITLYFVMSNTPS